MNNRQLGTLGSPQRLLPQDAACVPGEAGLHMDVHEQPVHLEMGHQGVNYRRDGLRLVRNEHKETEMQVKRLRNDTDILVKRLGGRGERCSTPTYFQCFVFKGVVY